MHASKAPLIYNVSAAGDKSLADERRPYQHVPDFSVNRIAAELSCLNVETINMFGSFARGGGHFYRCRSAGNSGCG